MFRLPAAFALLLLSLSCSTPPPVAETKPNYFWIGDDVSGSPRMVISLSQQRLFYFKGDKLVGASPVSTGREPGWTKTGTFRISQKDVDHRSSVYGSHVAEDGTVLNDDVDARTDPTPPGAKFEGAEMHYFMRVNGAVGMHKGYLPGYPASHGCIRLPGHMAETFFHATPEGTPVEVVSGPLHVQEPTETEKVLAEVKKPKPEPAPETAPAPKVKRPPFFAARKVAPAPAAAANKTAPAPTVAAAPAPKVKPPTYRQPTAPGLRYPAPPRPTQRYIPRQRQRESAPGSGWYFYTPPDAAVPRGATQYLEY